MARKNDKRFLQANREALFALAAYALYFLWWYLTAYGLGSDSPDMALLAGFVLVVKISFVNKEKKEE